MSSETAQLPEEEEQRSWSDRAAHLAATARALVATRLAIFQEELGEKAGLLGRGLAAGAAAAAFAVGALLLLAALLAALLAQLFHNTALGILGALLIYAAGAALAGRMAAKAFSGVKPGEFPATRKELSRDWAAIRSAVSPEDENEAEVAPLSPPPDEEVRDLEARLRGGAE